MILENAMLNQNTYLITLLLATALAGGCSENPANQTTSVNEPENDPPKSRHAAISVREIPIHVQQTPPGCLRDLAPIAVKTEPWDGIARWKLVCRCGSETGELLGHIETNQWPGREPWEIFVSPLAFKCSSCDSITEFLDTDLHGYDAEINALAGSPGGYTIRGTGERTPAACTECGKTELYITGLFSHSHFDLVRGEIELRPRAQDFFDAFWCEIMCTGCEHKSTLFEFELG